MKYKPDKIKQLQINEVNVKLDTLDDANFYPEVDVLVYDVLAGKNMSILASPKREKIQPKSADYKAMVFTRYFIQRKNTGIIIEVGQKQFDNFKDKLLLTVYTKLSLDWKIMGPRNDVIDGMGKIIVYGIEDTNLRTLQLKEKEMRGITQTLQNLAEYAIVTE